MWSRDPSIIFFGAIFLKGPVFARIPTFSTWIATMFSNRPGDEISTHACADFTYVLTIILIENKHHD
jgi:hypothetical protein